MCLQLFTQSIFQPFPFHSIQCVLVNEYVLQYKIFQYIIILLVFRIFWSSLVSCTKEVTSPFISGVSSGSNFHPKIDLSLSCSNQRKFWSCRRCCILLLMLQSYKGFIYRICLVSSYVTNEPPQNYYFPSFWDFYNSATFWRL